MSGTATQRTGPQSAVRTKCTVCAYSGERRSGLQRKSDQRMDSTNQREFVDKDPNVRCKTRSLERAFVLVG